MPIERLRGVYCVWCNATWLLPKVGAGDDQWVEVELVVGCFNAPHVLREDRNGIQIIRIALQVLPMKGGNTEWAGSSRPRSKCPLCKRFRCATDKNQWMILIRQPVNWLQFLECDVSTLVSISDRLLQAWRPPLMQPLRQQIKNSQWEIHLWERSCTTSLSSVSFKKALLYSRMNRGDASFRRAARRSRFSVNVTGELSLSCLFNKVFGGIAE